MFDASDAYRVHVCDTCGLLAVANLKKQAFECRSCRNKTAGRLGLLAVLVVVSQLTVVRRFPQCRKCTFLTQPSCCSKNCSP